MQGRRRFSAAEFNLARDDFPLKYASEWLLQKEKVDDLEALTDFISPTSNRLWWEALVRRQLEMHSGDNQLSDAESEVDDPDNINLDYVAMGGPASLP